jgi:hypothetical protein
MCTTTTLGTLKMWSLLTGGPYSKLTYFFKLKIKIGPIKWCSLQAGGCYSVEVVWSGLTVSLIWI